MKRHDLGSVFLCIIAKALQRFGRQFVDRIHKDLGDGRARVDDAPKGGKGVLGIKTGGGNTAPRRAANGVDFGFGIFEHGNYTSNSSLRERKNEKREMKNEKQRKK